MTFIVSVNICSLILSLRKDVPLEIADEDAEKISTVNEAVDYINSNS